MKNSKCNFLSNDLKLPLIGFGTFGIPKEDFSKAMFSAAQCGLQLMDTADNYNNELFFGRGLNKLLKAGKYKRTDFLIQTKISDIFPYEFDVTRDEYSLFSSNYISGIPLKKACDSVIYQSLRNMQIEYVDILLLHWPYPHSFIDIWHRMEYYYKEGLVKAIGVCNFRESHLKELISKAEIKPMINQFEIHPLNAERNLVEYCQLNNIQVEAYCPLGLMKSKIANSQVLLYLAEKHSKSIAQIILRWDIQRGILPIPKSKSYIRISENCDIFDFELSDEDMDMIYTLDEKFKIYVESLFCPSYRR